MCTCVCIEKGWDIQQTLFFLIFKKFIYFIYLFLAALGFRCCIRAFSRCGEWGATLRCGARASHCGDFSYCGAQALEFRLSSCGARASHCGGFSCCGAQALEFRLSSCGSRALECRLSSCGAQAQLLRGMWDLPGPGLEPVSPAWTGGFLTTAPPGKPYSKLLMVLTLGSCFCFFFFLLILWFDFF